MRALSRNTRRVTALTLAAALVIAVYLKLAVCPHRYRHCSGRGSPGRFGRACAVGHGPGRPAHRSRNSVGREQKTMGKHSWSAWQATAAQAFFEEARLKREKAHDEAMDTLQKTMKSSRSLQRKRRTAPPSWQLGWRSARRKRDRDADATPRALRTACAFCKSGRADLTVMTSVSR